MICKTRFVPLRYHIKMCVLCVVYLQELVEPPLLHELTTVDRLLITKRLPVKNVLCMRGKKNRFFVRTSDQNLIYTVEEENK